MMVTILPVLPFITISLGGKLIEPVKFSQATRTFGAGPITIKEGRHPRPFGGLVVGSLSWKSCVTERLKLVAFGSISVISELAGSGVFCVFATKNLPVAGLNAEPPNPPWPPGACAHLTV